MAACAYDQGPNPVGNQLPVIDDYYASPTVKWGQTWKLYIRAHDPDGDMWEARFDVEPPGYVGWNSPGLVILPKQYRGQFDGYMHLLISARAWDLGPANLTISAWLTDQGGRKSRVLRLPLAIGPRPVQPPPARFREQPIVPVPLDIGTDERFFD